MHFKNLWIRWMAVLLTAGLLMGCFGFAGSAEPLNVWAVSSEGAEEIDDADAFEYKKVASNGQLALYADMERGYFALEKLDTGDIWYSTPPDALLDERTSGAEKWMTRSQLTVEYLPAEDVMNSTAAYTADSRRGCLEDGSVTVNEIQNGIRVIYHFGELDVTIPVSYTLEGDSLMASIDLAAIDEGEDTLLTGITLLPYFGAGNWEAEGSLFVPDGCGALIHFNNGINAQPYVSTVYGDPLVDTTAEVKLDFQETVRLPVFATLMEEKALMGIITEGDGSASIRAVNGNEKRGYNAVGSVCELRTLEQLIMYKKKGANRRDIGRLTAWPTDASSYTVRYTPLSGEKASYVGVAQTYRSYLETEKGLTARVDTCALALDVYGSMDVKAAFLGFEYNKQEALTSFSQTQEILADLKANAVDQVAIRYLGWSQYGLLNSRVVTRAKALSNLGGYSGWKALEQTVAENGGVLYGDVDLLRFRKGSGSKAITDSFNQKIAYTERMRSVWATKLNLNPIYFLSPQYIQGNAQRYLQSVQKQGMAAVSFSTLGNTVYSNHSLKESRSFHRYFFPAEVQAVLSAYRKQGISVALEEANAYAAVYADRIYQAPTISSGYDSFDEEIPFYQLVFHGYIPMTVTTANAAQEADLNLLKAAESGSELLYGCMYADSSVVQATRFDNLYSTQYTLWRDSVLPIVQRYQELYKKVYDQPIVQHESVQEDVMRTTFANGVQVIVNYTREDVTVAGQTVAARDYYVTQGVVL